MTEMIPLSDRPGLHLLNGRIGVIGSNEEERWLHSSVGAVEGEAFFRCGNALHNCTTVRGRATVDRQATASGLTTVVGNLESNGSTPALVRVEGDTLLYSSASADELRFVVGDLTVGSGVDMPNLIGVAGDLTTDGKTRFPRLEVIGGRVLRPGVKRAGWVNHKIEINEGTMTALSKETMPALEIVNAGADRAEQLIRQRTMVADAVDAAGGLSDDTAGDDPASEGLGL